MEGVERAEKEAIETVGREDVEMSGVGEVERERVNEFVMEAGSGEAVMDGDRVAGWVRVARAGKDGEVEGE